MTEHQPTRPHSAASARDDAAIFDGWVDRYAAELFRFAWRVSGDCGIAEDLVQETFYEAWKHRGPLRSIREPRAWLFLILRRRYAKLRRYEKRRPVFAGLAETQWIPERRGDSGPGSLEASDALQAGLDAMADLYKLPLLMVFQEGLTCAEAAARLDVPLGTVLSRIHRGKEQLRAAMREQQEPTRDRADGAPRLRIGGA